MYTARHTHAARLSDRNGIIVGMTSSTHNSSPAEHSDLVWLPTSWNSDPTEVFTAEAYRRGFAYRRREHRNGRASDIVGVLPEATWVRLSQKLEDGEHLLAGTAELAVLIMAERGQVTVRVAAHDHQRAIDQLVLLWERLADRFETIEPSEVRFQFRTAQNGWAERVPCMDWNEIARNYMPGTRAGLTKLMSIDTFPLGRGRLLVWHGAPGTGKTTAIRALAHAWRDWCAPVYVADPEQLFADGNYFTDVLSGARRRRRFPPTDQPTDDAMATLILAEDCDDYLHADARLRAGSGLGRLLNLTDGLLGIGTRALVLVTTNEPLRQLHPALARPGRVLSEIEFTKFTPGAAHAWGITDAPGNLSLAEMYAKRETHHAPIKTSRPQPAGFQA